MNYDDIKAKILEILAGQKKKVVRIADLDPVFATEVQKAVIRTKLSARDRIFLSVQFNADPTIQFTAI
jgi:hypothetical protein